MHKFQLKDRQGALHTYVVTPHPPEEGLRLAFEVWGLAGRPLGRLLGELAGTVELSEVQRLFDLPKEQLKAELDRLLNTEALPKLLGALRSVNWSEVGAAITDGLRLLPTARVQELLRYTSRDAASLSQPKNFNDAYRQNYRELLQVVSEVVQYNGFLDFFDMSGSEASASPDETIPA